MYCNKCGNEIVNGSEFCSKCGTKIKQSSKKEKKEMSKRKRIFVIVLLSILCIYFSVGIISVAGITFSELSSGKTNLLPAFCLVLVLAILCGYELIKNIQKLRGKDKKELTAEQLQKRKKRNIIISIVSAFVIIVLCIIVNVLTTDKNNLQYNVKYIYEDSYIIFFEDGTYERQVEEIIKSNYTFDQKTNKIVCKEVQLVDGYEMDCEIHFEYISSNEIKQTLLKMLGIVPNGAEFGQIYSTENTLKETTVKEEIVKDTRMLHEEDNYEYIGFSSNGLQRMLLAFFEDGRLGIRTYSMNKYNGQYEQVGNIQWGTYQVKHNVIYAGNAMMTITSPDEVSKVQLFKYNGMEFTPIEVNNGNKNTNTNTQNSSSTNEQEYSPIDNGTGQ